MARRRIDDEAWGGLTIRLVQREDGRFDGIAFGKSSGTVAKIRGDPDETESEVRARLKQTAMRRHPEWVGYQGAVRFFRDQFQNGFHDDDYLKDEREYKWDAKEQLDEAVPLNAALDGGGSAKAVLRVFQRTNLLSPFELMRVRDTLRGNRGDAFVRGAAAFATGDMETGLRRMASALKPHDAAKWTVVTYLPFLWKPDAHMFLKPEITKLFADRVGHEFASQYRAELDLDVYRSLLDLAARTSEAIGALEPRDRIDVQSFIWVVGAYPSSQPSTD